MSSQIFPALAGLAWSVKRTPQWSSAIQEAISGRQTASAYWTAPRWRYELAYEMLRDYTVAGQSLAYSELQTLVGFFNARQGSFDPFLFQDPNDFQVTAQALGSGDGVTTQYQLVRAYGGFVEPVLAPNTVSDVAVSGVLMNAGSSGTVTTPTAPALSAVAGGSLGAATYYVKATRVAPSGETLASPESSLAVGAGNLLRVQAVPSRPGATGWNLYAGTASGGETLQNATPLPFNGAAWTEPAGGLVAGRAPPSGTNLSWSVSGWGTSGYAPGGVLTFSAAPASGAAILADFSYYWPCRFVDDAAELEQFMFQLWTLQKLQFQTLK